MRGVRHKGVSAELVPHRPAPRRTAMYAGEPAGLAWLKVCGIEAEAFKDKLPTGNQLLVIGPGGAKELSAQGTSASEWVKAGGRVLAAGLDQAEADSFLPKPVTIRPAEYIVACFNHFTAKSPFLGVGMADVHNRDPRTLPLLGEGAASFGGGVLGTAGGVVFCQLVPWHFAQDPEHFNQRRTFQHASFALSRILANLGVSGSTPLLGWFSDPVGGANGPSLVRNGDFGASTKNNGVADEWECSPSGNGASCSLEALYYDPQKQRLQLIREPPFQGTRPAQVISVQGDASIHLQGLGCAQLITVPPVAVGAKPPEVMLAQHDIPIRGGQWYRFSVVTRAEDLSCKQISWTVQNTANWQALFDYENITPKSEWQTNSFVLQAKQTVNKGTKLQIWFTGTGKLWLANARLEPVPAPTDGRWLTGLYLTRPTEWDDPYRFFGW